MKTILAWHFLPADRKLLHGNGQRVRVGRKIIYGGDLKLCVSGLHASRRPIDALEYITGPILCRVRCDGTIIEDTDKLVCSERTVLYWFDASVMLRAFARRCALDVIHLWNPPEVVVRYLKTGDKDIRDAAGAAARAAASAAGAAAGATWAAARDSQNRRLLGMIRKEHNRKKGVC